MMNETMRCTTISTSLLCLGCIGLKITNHVQMMLSKSRAEGGSRLSLFLLVG